MPLQLGHRQALAIDGELARAQLEVQALALQRGIGARVLVGELGLAQGVLGGEVVDLGDRALGEGALCAVPFTLRRGTIDLGILRTIVPRQLQRGGQRTETGVVRVDDFDPCSLARIRPLAVVRVAAALAEGQSVLLCAGQWRVRVAGGGSAARGALADTLRSAGLGSRAI